MSRASHPVANFFPLMTGQEFDALVDDVREHGLREAIWLHQDGRIVDGRNRYRACVEAGVDPAFQTYIGPDDSLTAFVVSMNLKRRHLDESQCAMVAARIADMPQGARTDLAQICAMSQDEAADKLQVSRRSVQHAAKVLKEGAEEIVGAVDQGAVKVSDAATIVDRGGPRISDRCGRWDPTFMRRISRDGEATEFFGGLQGESRVRGFEG